MVVSNVSVLSPVVHLCDEVAGAGAGNWRGDTGDGRDVKGNIKTNQSYFISIQFVVHHNRNKL
jgi:hypothetical protein